VSAELPARFADWFAGRGWRPRGHQLALLDGFAARRATLLIAPTGAGKTLAGFLPSLVDLTMRPRNRGGLHTLYISPLKALAVDIARNLDAPIAEMGLPIRVETRTGDTPASRRARQKRDPPDILLTTPEQIALLLASPDAEALFGGLEIVIVDELHALAANKRGDLLCLGLARLKALSPRLVAFGLSATVRDPPALARWLSIDPPAAVVTADRAVAAPPDIRVLDSAERLPWAGHTAKHAMAEIYAAIKAHRMTLVFVNTRMQAEFCFQLLWSLNEDGLKIALHHGSLDVSQRRRVEAAMAEGRLDAIVCTSTLDLGIDWGDVDLVVNVGAPKGASRLLQRVGRANHRLDEPSRAILVPSNRFEVMECRAAIEAAEAGAQDAEVARAGALDVLAQHTLGRAVAGPFDPDAYFAEVAGAAPYADLPRADFDRVIEFVATGGYALKSYERFAKIRKDKLGRWRIANPRVAQGYRMNIGTIVEATMLKVRLGRAGRAGAGQVAFGRTIGEIEEYFAETMTPGDTFVFGGEVLRYEAIHEDSVIVSRASGSDPKVPSYAGGKFPLSTHLAERVRRMLATPGEWPGLGPQVDEWLRMQALRSVLPARDEMLVETFPRGGRFHIVAYPFDGRLAHQTLGMLLTRRLERARLKPQGFVCNDYSLSVWGLGDVSAHAAARRGFIDALFDEDMLGDDLEEWLAESALMKRTFRYCAVISGLIERRFPGVEKKGRQVTMSTDLVYDVLRRHEPDHILLKAARADAATGLLDIRRLADLLARVRGRIVHRALDRPSPLSVPVLLEIGREAVYGEAGEAILEAAAAELVREAMGDAADGAGPGRMDAP
jgi:ATP-dependent Lhr-like helicase